MRTDLLDWYARRGYRPTGRRIPFRHGDPRFGLPRRADLEFVVLAARWHREALGDRCPPRRRARRIGCRDLPRPGSSGIAGASSVTVRRAGLGRRPPRGCSAPRSGVVEQAPGSGRTVALTFDDGPGPWTPKILEVLARYGVRATFFDTGAHDVEYRQYARTEVIAGGVIGNHTWDHRYPSQVPGGWTESYLRDQLTRTERRACRTADRPRDLPVPCARRGDQPGAARGRTLVGADHGRLERRTPRTGANLTTPSRAAVRRIVAAATDSPGETLRSC